jgi:hypothetical protein
MKRKYLFTTMTEVVIFLDQVEASMTMAEAAMYLYKSMGRTFADMTMVTGIISVGRLMEVPYQSTTMARLHTSATRAKFD